LTSDRGVERKPILTPFSLVIRKGTLPFGASDKFAFSTFRTGGLGNNVNFKKNEIDRRHIPLIMGKDGILAEEKQFNELK